MDSYDLTDDKTESPFGFSWAKRMGVIKLLDTMRRLGDATSRNLAFSYRSDVPVSYGEETITESNLLELRRQHSDVVHLRTFSKHQESKFGADWEWYIIGHARTLAMRVQAKRVQRNDLLRIRHTVGQTGRQQHDLLIESAKADEMRPMYCIYCTESQRSLWKQVEEFETGCLLADAGELSVDTSRLNSVEDVCWPWHFLLAPDIPAWMDDYLLQLKGVVSKTGKNLPPSLKWDGPSIQDLNEYSKREFNLTGVKDNTTLDLPKLTTDSDVRTPDEPEETTPVKYFIDQQIEPREERLPVEYDQNQQIEFSVKGKVVIDLRSLGTEHKSPS